MSFHEIRFPTHLSRGAAGGPERRTDLVVLGSGFEERNARWHHARRTYNAGYGIRSLDDLDAIIQFFEERRGRLHGFRWKDHADWKSCRPQQTPEATDQMLGSGDGSTVTFQLVKRYGHLHAPYLRPIVKPVAGTVRIAVDGVPVGDSAAAVDPTSGIVTFAAGAVPPAGAEVTAGYEFDVPVRFDADRLEINVAGIGYGAVPAIPVVELRL